MNQVRRAIVLSLWLCGLAPSTAVVSAEDCPSSLATKFRGAAAELKIDSVAVRRGEVLWFERCIVNTGDALFVHWPLTHLKGYVRQGWPLQHAFSLPGIAEFHEDTSTVYIGMGREPIPQNLHRAELELSLLERALRGAKIAVKSAIKMLIPTDAEHAEKTLESVELNFDSTVVRPDPDHYLYEYVWSDERAAERAPFAFSVQSSTLQKISGGAVFDASFEDTTFSFTSQSSPILKVVALEFRDESGRIVGSGSAAILVPEQF